MRVGIEQSFEGAQTRSFRSELGRARAGGGEIELAGHHSFPPPCAEEHELAGIIFGQTATRRPRAPMRNSHMTCIQRQKPLEIVSAHARITSFSSTASYPSRAHGTPADDAICPYIEGFGGA